MPFSLILALASLLIMVTAFFLNRYRPVHISLMVVVLIIDLTMPFYLYNTGDWPKRLIEREEIFSFLIWMHFGLVLTVYVLFTAQIITALKVIKNDAEARKIHYNQGRALILVKVLVVMTGAVLVE